MPTHFEFSDQGPERIADIRFALETWWVRSPSVKSDAGSFFRLLVWAHPPNRKHGNLYKLRGLAATCAGLVTLPLRHQSQSALRRGPRHAMLVAFPTPYCVLDVRYGGIPRGSERNVDRRDIAQSV